MSKIHVCPRCGHRTFLTVAHVAQTWEVDEYGNWIGTISDDETVAAPDDGNIWNCSHCGEEAIIVEEEEKKPPHRETLHWNQVEIVSVDSDWLKVQCKERAEKEGKSFWEFYSCIPHEAIKDILMEALQHVDASRIEGENFACIDRVNQLQYLQGRLTETRMALEAVHAPKALLPNIEVGLAPDMGINEPCNFIVLMDGKKYNGYIGYSETQSTINSWCEAAERAAKLFLEVRQ